MPRGVYDRKKTSKQGRLVSTIPLEDIPTHHPQQLVKTRTKKDDNKRLVAALIVLCNRLLGD